ncbi:hypothetical protein EW146_g8982 [Bondarzewia mesenterica]|uniref:Histone chaperone RTT106/FACT complex subunit SPT16-like middle domain-containing protein n=1 Tax=Bondarzewia mesenterica TaxID=1095465 RepID=A0A4S4LAE0_9AGAM|nr:hypothetical protein EW146_g8982 [Bondarzewia mesenterica]
MTSSTPYLQTLLSCLPEEYKSATEQLVKTASSSALVDTFLRLATNGPYPTNARAQTQHTWSKNQSSFQSALRSLHDESPTSTSSQTSLSKRKRSASPPPPSKKLKHTGVPPESDAISTSNSQNDRPLYTLHALSATSPVRKKVDITIHEHTLRLTNPASRALEASIPLSALKRAFLLPTRGKAKPHWTVVLMSHDAPARPAQKFASSSANANAHYQAIFGVDAEPTASFSITNHASQPDSPLPAKETFPKSGPTRPALLAFLGHLPSSCPLFEPSSDAFRSTSGAQGIGAYRGAKECTLWFLKQGILGEGKPCEFWAFGDLKGSRRGLESRHCEGAQMYEGEETEFGMVDGREQDNIRQWVRKYRHLFGRQSAVGKRTVNGVIGTGTNDVNGGERADADEEGDDVLRDSDDEDSEFEMSSVESDGGSPSSGTSDSEADGGQDSGEEGGDEDEEEEGGSASAGSAGEEDGDEEDLDPKHSPPHAPGAVPKMSRAAMDVAVGMAVGELMSGSGPSRRKVEVDGEEDEEDELDE